jgi:hypothetical protein
MNHLIINTKEVEWSHEEGTHVSDRDTVTLDEWAEIINQNNENLGWNVKRSEAEWAALAHTEISEYYEEFRNGHEARDIYYNQVDKDSKNNKPEGQAIEMADLLIRTLHWFAQNGMSPSYCVALKMQYNTTRPFRHGEKKA